MNRTAARLAIGVMISAMWMFGAESSLGTWKMNLAKSKFTGTNVTKGRTDVRVATPDGGVKATQTEQLTDGTSRTINYTYKFDGKEYPVTGAPYDVISVKKVDADTVAYDVKKTGGKYHVTGQSVVSKDGKTRTQTAKGTDAEGKPVSSTMVFEKQ